MDRPIVIVISADVCGVSDLCHCAVFMDSRQWCSYYTALGQQKWQRFIPHPTFEALLTFRHVNSLSYGLAWGQHVSLVVANSVTVAD